MSDLFDLDKFLDTKPKVHYKDTIKRLSKKTGLSIKTVTQIFNALKEVLIEQFYVYGEAKIPQIGFIRLSRKVQRGIYEKRIYPNRSIFDPVHSRYIRFKPLDEEIRIYNPSLRFRFCRNFYSKMVDPKKI